MRSHQQSPAAAPSRAPLPELALLLIVNLDGTEVMLHSAISGRRTAGPRSRSGRAVLRRSGHRRPLRFAWIQVLRSVPREAPRFGSRDATAPTTSHRGSSPCAESPAVGGFMASWLLISGRHWANSNS